MAVDLCTNLKHWKISCKKSCGRYIGFTRTAGVVVEGTGVRMWSCGRGVFFSLSTGLRWVTGGCLGHFFLDCEFLNASKIFWHFFLFYIFQNHFSHKYIFNFTIYKFVPLPPGRGAAGGRPPHRWAAGRAVGVQTCKL